MGADQSQRVASGTDHVGSEPFEKATLTTNGAKPYVLKTNYILNEIALEGGFDQLKFRGVCAGYFDPIGVARLAALNSIEAPALIAQPMLMFAVSRLLKHDPWKEVRSRALHLAMHAYTEMPEGDPRRIEVLGDIVSRVFDNQRHVQDTAIRFFEKQPWVLVEPFRIRGFDGIHIAGDAAILAMSKGLAEGKPGAVSQHGTRSDITQILVTALNEGKLPERVASQVELDLRRLLNPDSEYREKDEGTRAILLSGVAELLYKPNILSYFVRSLGTGSTKHDTIVLDRLYSFLSANGNLEKFVPIEMRGELAAHIETVAKKYRTSSAPALEGFNDSSDLASKCDQVRELLPGA